MHVQQARPLVEPPSGRPTSQAADDRRRGDQELADALASGMLLHPAANGGDSEVARSSPPQGPAPGFYAPTSAYRDILSWPTFVFRALMNDEPIPEPWARAIRPAHELAVRMYRSMMMVDGKMQVAAAREITDRVEGPVVQRSEASVTVSHVLVTPGRYPRPTFPSSEAQVLEAQVVGDSDQD